MPRAFEICRKDGGKIRTVSGPRKVGDIELKAGQYMHICILKDKVYPGEVKTKKKRYE